MVMNDRTQERKEIIKANQTVEILGEVNRRKNRKGKG